MRKTKNLIMYFILIALIFCFSIFFLYLKEEKTYKNMIATPQSVKKWEADTQPLIEEMKVKKFAVKKVKGLAPSDIDTIVIPGLRGAWSVTNNTKEESFGTNWVPQGLTQSKNRYYVSLYDGDHERNSLIFVIDKKTKKYIKTLILDSKSHVGGIAYDSHYKRLWFSDDTNKMGGLSYIEGSSLDSYHASKKTPIIASKKNQTSMGFTYLGYSVIQ